MKCPNARMKRWVRGGGPPVCITERRCEIGRGERERPCQGGEIALRIQTMNDLRHQIENLSASEKAELLDAVWVSLESRRSVVDGRATRGAGSAHRAP
jgi:hypothetical protein